MYTLSAARRRIERGKEESELLFIDNVVEALREREGKRKEGEVPNRSTSIAFLSRFLNIPQRPQRL
jgi:hypothetical protein